VRRQSARRLNTLTLRGRARLSAGGLAGRSLYIHTEGRAALGRLAALAASRFPQLPGACDSVLVANASAGPEQLCDALQQVEALCASPPAGLPPVRLLVLDSIAHPFRDLDMSGRGAGAARAVLLYRVAAQLKALAQTHSLAVVVTNQVTDCVDDGQRQVWEQVTGGGALSTSGRRVQPALGLHWAHSVTTRLFLSRASPPGARAADREVVRCAPAARQRRCASHAAAGECASSTRRTCRTTPSASRCARTACTAWRWTWTLPAMRIGSSREVLYGNRGLDTFLDRQMQN